MFRYHSRPTDNARIDAFSAELAKTEVPGEVEDIASISRAEIGDFFLSLLKEASLVTEYEDIWVRWIAFLSRQYLRTGLTGDLDAIRQVASEVELEPPENIASIENHITALEANRVLTDQKLFVIPSTTDERIRNLWNQFDETDLPSFRSIRDVFFDKTLANPSKYLHGFRLIYGYRRKGYLLGEHDYPEDSPGDWIEEPTYISQAEEKIHVGTKTIGIEETRNQFSSSRASQDPVDSCKMVTSTEFPYQDFPDVETFSKFIELIFSEPERYWFTTRERGDLIKIKEVRSIQISVYEYLLGPDSSLSKNERESITKEFNRYKNILIDLLSLSILPNESWKFFHKNLSNDQQIKRISEAVNRTLYNQNPKIPVRKITMIRNSEEKVEKTTYENPPRLFTIDTIRQEINDLQARIDNGFRLSTPKEISEVLALFIESLTSQEKEHPVEISQEEIRKIHNMESSLLGYRKK